MWLAVDSGNTRVKWALFRGSEMLSCAAAKHPATAGLSAAARGREVWLSHVGGGEALRRLEGALAGASRLVRIRPRAEACGVTNRYQPPQTLGGDRWLCLLAARRRFRRAVVIVSAGTAVTVDLLAADGVFTGGLILPGLRLMAAGLRQATTLPSPGTSRTLPSLPPNNTRAAMAAGAALALCGAAREFRRRCAPRAPLLLTGGDSELLSPWLPTAQLTPNLTLHGIARLREEEK